jgi:hypothetical protein
MCFSAGASFGASAVLGIVGVKTLKKVEIAKQVPFASIPLLFAFQQVAEGVLWIGLSNATHESWTNLPVYAFLVFAQLVWPVWVPLSVLQLERGQKRRIIIKTILGLGVAISLYLTYCMFTYDVKAEIHSGHIVYTLSFPMAFAWISSVLYFIPTVVPLFVSSNKRISLLGLAVLISFIFTKIYFEEHVISVWCFFAALLSIMVLWITSKFKVKAQ